MEAAGSSVFQAPPPLAPRPSPSRWEALIAREEEALRPRRRRLIGRI